jgi:hypothetical protein
MWATCLTHPILLYLISIILSHEWREIKELMLSKNKFVRAFLTAKIIYFAWLISITYWMFPSKRKRYADFMQLPFGCSVFCINIFLSSKKKMFFEGLWHTDSRILHCNRPKAETSCRIAGITHGRNLIKSIEVGRPLDTWCAYKFLWKPVLFSKLLGRKLNHEVDGPSISLPLLTRKKRGWKPVLSTFRNQPHKQLLLWPLFSDGCEHAPTTFAMFVCVTQEPLKEFSLNFILGSFTKGCPYFHIWLKLYKNYGHFTWKNTYMYLWKLIRCD